MALHEIGDSRVFKVVLGFGLLAGAMFLPVVLDPWGLGLVAAVGGVVMAWVGVSVLGSVPDVLRIVPPILLSYLPGLHDLLDRQREIAARRSVVREMRASLDFYGLESLDEVPWGEVEMELVEDPALHGKPIGDLVERCARSLAGPLSLPPEVLEILYHERIGEVGLPLWPPPVEVRPVVFSGLARVLAHSPIIRQQIGAELEVEGPELERLLAGMIGFSLERLLAELRRVRDAWQTGHAYWAFLGRNLSGLGKAPSVRQMVDAASAIGGRAGGYQVATVLDALGRRAVETWLEARDGEPALSPDEREALGLLAEILFFVRSGLSPFGQGLAPQCVRLGELPAGVSLAWVYLVAKQEFRSELWGERERFLRLELFLERRSEVLGRRPERADELQSLEAILVAGQWPISRQELLGRLVGKEEEPASVEEVTPVEHPEAVEQAGTTGPRRAAKRVEGPVTIPLDADATDADRAERLAEVQGARAYLITLGRSAGPVPKVLDALTRANPERYQFTQYTPFSRLGVVPRGVAFIDFCQRLREDLSEELGALSGNGDGSSYEVLIHAFQPAESNPFVLGHGEKPAMETVQEILGAELRGAGEGGP